MLKSLCYHEYIQGKKKGETTMIMTKTKKGYSVVADNKKGRELVMEMIRASCQVIQELSLEKDCTNEEVLQDIMTELWGYVEKDKEPLAILP